MASIQKEFPVKVPPQFAWEAIKDVGAIHTRLVRGFVTDTLLRGDTRTVTFANGLVVQEQIVTIDEARRRLVYHAVGGRASHHNASLQVFAAPDETATLLWITDLLPDEMEAPIAQMVEAGAAAMQRTLEQSFKA